MRVLESILYAEDLEAAHRFYTQILGLEEISFDPARSLFLRCEGSVLILFKASKTVIKDTIVPAHGTIGAGHLAFASTPEGLEVWATKLQEAGIEIIDRITWPNSAISIYFRDPAGNILEFATPNLWGL